MLKEAVDLQQLVDLANRNVEAIHQMTAAEGITSTEAIARILEGSDIVWGLVNDSREELGVGMHLIRGKGRLMLLSQSKNGAEAKINALACRTYEEAEAFRMVFGDGRHHNKR